MSPTTPKSRQPPPILPDSDWSKRHSATSFRSLMRLEHHPSKQDTYLSTSAAYPPTPTTRTYGGHVFAQSACAAAHTVPHGLHVHSITGYFLLLGDTRYAFEYRVRRVRDGGVYALRIVEAFQESEAAGYGKTPTFMCIVSFKRDERAKHRVGIKGERRDFQHQEVPEGWVEKEYERVLRRNGRERKFEEWPVTQGMDGMWPSLRNGGMNVEEWKQRGDAFPGLEMRKVDMAGYNKKAVLGGLEDGGVVARDWRLLLVYRIVEDEDENDVQARQRSHKGKKTGADDVINLHACAHLYASDRNSLFLTQRALGFERMTGHIGSLSHTVNFHAHADELLMSEKDGRRKVFTQESWVSNSGADRVTHNSRLWDRETGRVLATTVQDGMLRISAEGEKEVIDGDALLRREAKL